MEQVRREEDPAQAAEWAGVENLLLNQTQTPVEQDAGWAAD
jgi:hypothetical protein